MRNFILATVFVLMSFPDTAHSNLIDYRTATWNMQGSSAATESKWNVNVRQLIQGPGAVRVLAIQEAGSVPATARLTNRQIPSPAGTIIPIREYEWNLGTRSREEIRYIYFVDWDTGAGRVNPAIVTDTRADEVVPISNPIISQNQQPNRPIVGVGFRRPGQIRAQDYFFTIHAFATGGGDAAPAVEAIHNHFSANGPPSAQWLIMGDYNINPATLQTRIDRRNPNVARNVSIITQSSPTQTSGNTLDYAVAGQVGAGQILARALAAAMFVAQLYGQNVSDHVPVTFYRR
ncbi:Cytolethal distending toxin subunit B [Candidatus Burkholderia brachyanthoides]|nr:Cytolethal distending toxin subunit B [Candidatus Burkholderia brachyanthoides]